MLKEEEDSSVIRYLLTGNFWNTCISPSAEENSFISKEYSTLIHMTSCFISPFFSKSSCATPVSYVVEPRQENGIKLNMMQLSNLWQHSPKKVMPPWVIPAILEYTNLLNGMNLFFLKQSTPDVFYKLEFYWRLHFMSSLLILTPFRVNGGSH